MNAAQAIIHACVLKTRTEAADREAAAGKRMPATSQFDNVKEI